LSLEGIKPLQESGPERRRSGVLEAGDNVEIDNAGGIERHEAIDVLCPNGLGSIV
jgi:hypothetical protein